MESVKTLVDEFSQFARFPAAQPVRCDLNEVVREALAVFQGRLDGIDHARAASRPDLPPVNLDREQFQRVVVNLVDNAAEAMQDSLVKHLYIATQPGAAETVELVVADSGCGVSPDDKEKLFLPYFSTKGRGTGLGLAIVSHIVAEHGAHIRVEDNQPAGARFTVEIPALVEPESGEPGAAAGRGARMKTSAHPGCGRRAGHPPVAERRAGGRRLRGRTPSESGEACLDDAAAARDFELVLLDIWLPGMDGMEVLARIQEIPFAERPVVVMISGHGTIEAAVKATKLGAFDFLEKPLSIEKVSVVVKNALEHRRLALENSRLKDDTRSALPHHRRERAHEGAAPAAGADGGHQRARADLRRERHGQGTGGARLHAMSPRAAEPFVEVNCAAIPEELIESELFGHIKGSFTGAHEDKIGKFQKADGGTLFLDEVGDMSLRTQAKVLRALEEQRFEPVGAAESDAGGRARGGRHQQEPGRGDRARQFPRGPVLPPERDSVLRAAAARPARRHPAAGRLFPARVHHRLRPQAQGADAGGLPALCRNTTGPATCASCRT